MKYLAEEHLPRRFKTIKEFYDFCMAQDPEFENAEAIKNKGLNNVFPKDVDIDGARMWETALGITPNANDTLEDRKFRILTVLQQRTPYTWAQLHRMMEALCGKDGYEIKKGYFTLMVYIAMESVSQLRSVLRMLEDVVPMHILLDITQLLNYAFNVDIYSYVKNTGELTILPYQERAGTYEVRQKVIHLPIVEGKLIIKPYPL